MHHKITHAMVGIVAAAFIIAAAVFGLITLVTEPDVEAAAARRPVIPLIAHPVNEQMADCAACHPVGPGSLPPSHATYGAHTCRTCHAVASAEELAAREAARAAAPEQAPPQGPSAIPHPVNDAYANCTGCHAIGGNRGMPENHASYTNEMCVSCHQAVSAEDGAAAATQPTGGLGPLTPHAIDGQFVNCDTCHAQDMGRLAMPEDHTGFTKETCTNCHKPAE